MSRVTHESARIKMLLRAALNGDPVPLNASTGE